MSDLVSSLVARELDGRLAHGAAEPLAVAFSGGGDSLALLLAAKAWADEAGRRIVAFTVDHQLLDWSGEWVAWCAARAGRIGIDHRALAWEGPKPSTGVPAAARAARHRLIAEAAREADAKVVLFGHTADDVLEAEAMRADGVRISSPQVWSPSPVWPEGRRLFILRPLITARRSELRHWLRAMGETWIDDPVNEDMHQPRARARAALAGARRDRSEVEAAQVIPAFGCSFGPAGEIVQLRPFRGPASELRDWLGVAVVCAAGAERPLRREPLRRLAERLTSNEAFAATLGGARIIASESKVTLCRETRDRRGRSCAAIELTPGRLLVWDGRFEVLAHEGGFSMTALGGHASRLNAEARGRLAMVSSAARAALPAVIDKAGAVSCPTLVRDPRFEVRSLALNRMAGVFDMIENEARIDLFA